MTRRPGTHLQPEVSLPPGFVPPSAALVTSRPSRPNPTGDTRAGDLRYNIMVRLGNMGCTCPVDHMGTQELTEYWRLHTPAGQNEIRQQLVAEGRPWLAQHSPCTYAAWADQARAPVPTGHHILGRDDILSSEGWIEVTAMGSREREWLPPHPPPELAGPSFCLGCGKDLSWCECETVQPAPPRPDRRTLLARQYDRVGGPVAGDLADKREWLPPRFRVAYQLGSYPADGPCVDCGMRDEPADLDHRCRFCAELAAIRQARPQEAPGGILIGTESTGGISPGTLSAVAIVLLFLVLAAGVGLLLSGALR
jgi:hypothetical protein